MNGRREQAGAHTGPGVVSSWAKLRTGAYEHSRRLGGRLELLTKFEES